MGMTTIQESRILEALQQAQRVGLVEESVTVCGCTVVMRNLLPNEYKDIIAESSDKQDADFLYTYQLGHICRSVCEIGGIDLRGLDYIETEMPDPKNPGQQKKVKLERHEWLRSRVFSTWGREALSVLYRKFVDVLDKAEKQSVEGVTFVVPDESNDDKYRRLLGELAELEGELPDELVAHLLEERGYRRKKDDQKAAANKLDTMAAAEQRAPAPLPSEENSVTRPVHSLVVQRSPGVQMPTADIPPPQAVIPPGVDPTELIRRKTPGEPKSRAEQIAELEAATVNLANVLPAKPEEAEKVVLEKPQPKLDPVGAASILDRPPTAGINPRFRHHGR